MRVPTFPVIASAVLFWILGMYLILGLGEGVAGICCFAVSSSLGTMWFTLKQFKWLAGISGRLEALEKRED